MESFNTDNTRGRFTLTQQKSASCHMNAKKCSTGLSRRVFPLPRDLFGVRASMALPGVQQAMFSGRPFHLALAFFSSKSSIVQKNRESERLFLPCQLARSALGKVGFYNLPRTLSISIGLTFEILFYLPHRALLAVV